MVFGWPQIPCIGTSRHPRASYCRGLVNDGLHPGGVSRYLSQLYGPLRASYAKMLGLILDFHSKVNVFRTCNGNTLSVIARATMNASLNVWIALSAALTRWLCGSTTCKSQPFVVRKFLMYLVAWLSMTLIWVYTLSLPVFQITPCMLPKCCDHPDFS
jgi:hypothetical protein